MIDMMVEKYLDELFDRVAGQGAAGRRMLAETEDHLRSAVEEGIANGLSREAAEAAAVARFGEPDRMAALVDRVHGSSALLRAGFQAVRVAGLALVMLAGLYLATTVVVYAWVGGPVCSRAFVPCDGNVRIVTQIAFNGALLLALGGAALGLARLAPATVTRPRHAALAAALAVLVGVVVLLDLPIVVGLIFHAEHLWRRAALVTTGLALMNFAVVAGHAFAVRRRAAPPVEVAA